MSLIEIVAQDGVLGADQVLLEDVTRECHRCLDATATQVTQRIAYWADPCSEMMMLTPFPNA